MGQLGFFDADKRLEALSAKGDPLEVIDRLVPWESFRAEIEAVVLTPDELKKSSAGRKPFDAILMFRMLVLQALNNLSDEQLEYQVRDRQMFRDRSQAIIEAKANEICWREHCTTITAGPCQDHDA
jgi:transposase, IS5 family